MPSEQYLVYLADYLNVFAEFANDKEMFKKFINKTYPNSSADQSLIDLAQEGIQKLKLRHYIEYQFK